MPKKDIDKIDHEMISYYGCQLNSKFISNQELQP